MLNSISSSLAFVLKSVLCSFLDAVSTLCSALTNIATLVVIYNSSSYWWLDGTSGSLVAFYTLFSGGITMHHSNVSYFFLCVTSHVCCVTE